MYKDSCEEFIQKLNSAAPVPGGGGASALFGAAGAALGGMVLNIAAGKKKADECQAEREACIREAEALEKKFLQLMNQDAEGFLPLSKAYGMPKNTEEEKKERDRVMQAALLSACEAPLAMEETAVQALGLMERCLTLGAKMAVSDVGVGAAALKAAADGAYLNVLINAKMVKDVEKQEALMAKATGLKEEADQKADTLYGQVIDKL